jgi:hypothetical protein
VVYQWIKEAGAEQGELRERHYLLLRDVLLLASRLMDEKNGSVTYQLRLHVTLNTTRAERAPLPASILHEKWGIPLGADENNSSSSLPLRSILLHTPKKPILLFAPNDKDRQDFLSALEKVD